MQREQSWPKTPGASVGGASRARSEQKDDPDEVRIQEEIKQHGDIWRLDMVDTYADLSMKTLKMFTVLPQKIDADFYFKIDDDVAVNVDAMAAYLTQRRNQGNLYLARPPGAPARALDATRAACMRLLRTLCFAALARHGVQLQARSCVMAGRCIHAVRRRRAAAQRRACPFQPVSGCGMA